MTTCSHFPHLLDEGGTVWGQLMAQQGQPLVQGCPRKDPTVGGGVGGLLQKSYNASPLFFLLPGASVQPPHFFSDPRFSEIPSKQTFAQNLKTTKAKYLHTLQSPSSQEARSHTRSPSSGARRADPQVAVRTPWLLALGALQVTTHQTPHIVFTRPRLKL